LFSFILLFVVLCVASISQFQGEESNFFIFFLNASQWPKIGLFKAHPDTTRKSGPLWMIGDDHFERLFKQVGSQGDPPLGHFRGQSDG